MRVLSGRCGWRFRWRSDCSLLCGGAGTRSRRDPGASEEEGLRLTVTLLAGLVWPTVASASPRFHIRGRASCPAPAALARALADLLPAEPAVEIGRAHV